MMATARWATATTMARSDDNYGDNDVDGGDGATGDEVDIMAMTTTMATARREMTMVTTMAKGDDDDDDDDDDEWRRRDG